MTSWHNLPSEVKSLILELFTDEVIAPHYAIHIKTGILCTTCRHCPAFAPWDREQWAIKQMRNMLQGAPEMYTEALRQLNDAHAQAQTSCDKLYRVAQEFWIEYYRTRDSADDSEDEIPVGECPTECDTAYWAKSLLEKLIKNLGE